MSNSQLRTKFPRSANPAKEAFSKLRREMVEKAIVARGVRSELVLGAMRSVPREAFLPHQLREFAYTDSPLPIEEGQTISQPYIVAFMTEALALQGGERVLEIGTGSGYAAAVLAEIAADVYTVERIGQLAEKAASTLADLGYDNVHVLHSDGTKGWPEHAPYDGIIVAAGGPTIPESLKAQLKIGGRLVIPVGRDPKIQELVRVTRISENEYRREDLADVRFVPLIGHEGWTPAEQPPTPSRQFKRVPDKTLAQTIADHCEPFDAIESAQLDPLLARIGDARIVLLGEASHGTSEFYRMRERISRELITKRGFRFVAIEGDWPDAARVDHYVRHLEYPPSEWTAFARFPVWMWRNNEVGVFIDWLRHHNAPLKDASRFAFHGLDLYSLYDSIRAVLKYLDQVDPQSAGVARERYGCLTPWQSDPATYGHAALTGAYPTCEADVVRVLTRALHGRGAKCPPHYQRRTLLSHHVLWLARILESARQPHVRNLEDIARLLWPQEQGNHLGSQFSHRQRCRDRDVFPRRIQSRASLPQGIRRPRLRHRFRHTHRNRGGSVELGWPDGGQDGAAVNPRQLRTCLS
jgi:protein-L-isoaspartate(D-aspartate) O-methyltransferase